MYVNHLYNSVSKEPKKLKHIIYDGINSTDNYESFLDVRSIPNLISGWQDTEVVSMRPHYDRIYKENSGQDPSSNSQHLLPKILL